MALNRAGETRYGVHSIDHFALEVPSLSKAHDFFAHLGLDVVRHDSRRRSPGQFRLCPLSKARRQQLPTDSIGGAGRSCEAVPLTAHRAPRRPRKPWRPFWACGLVQP